ncbi:hypothetical protein GCM10011495_35640 [Hymenobacter frigidus]|uniref:Uncharacterized protein n=1 Tax=Hymenobacter frigidus TaxID=1524095 RepID=A0ABQ2AH76_9BACT|nr:hypothetical protein [Hymenobacter frigidus]GGH90234.1 hypothetical protein GCM10011495_35640 [Hymenobacter frigidus]
MNIPSTKKILLIIGGVLALCIALSEFGLYWQRKDTPTFLLDMWDHLPENPRMVARLGEDALPKYGYNVYDVEKDTLPYSFSLHGYKGNLEIKGYAVKQQNRWVPVKSDTLFISNK